MLVIRDEQMDALRARVDPALVAALVAHLRAIFPDETAGQDEATLTAYVDTVLRRARRYALFTDQDQCRFVNLAMRYGMDWETADDRRWIHDALLDPAGGSPSRRLARVMRQCLYDLETSSSETVDKSEGE